MEDSNEALRKRKAHAAITLKKVNKTNDAAPSFTSFMSLPQFQNTLPSISTGPYFKEIPMSCDFSDFAAERRFTLEKDFVWGPQFGGDAGLQLDLVDQEAMVTLEGNLGLDVAAVRSEKYLLEMKEGNRSKRDNLETKPTWLRNTTYLENNLYVSWNKIKSGDSDDKKKSKNGDAPTVYDSSYAYDSFDDVNRCEKRCKESKEHGGVDWCVPLLPTSDYSSLAVTLTQFGDDPIDQNSSLSAEDQHYRLRRGLTVQPRAAAGDNSTSLMVSMVAPVVGDDDSKDKMEYTWINDYYIEVSKEHVPDMFVIVIPPPVPAPVASEEEDDSRKSENHASFMPIKTRFQLRKCPIQEAQPHLCTVSRTV